MKISVRELKDHFSEYLRRVSAGEEVLVTSRKRVVAKLVPPSATEKKESRAGSKQVKMLPCVRHSGSKPQRRAGIAVKAGERTMAESILNDRR